MSFSPKPATIAACLAFAAAGGGATVLSASASASTVRSADQSTTGTATVSITGAAGKTHTRTVPVSCQVISGRYTVHAAKRGQHGSGLRVSVTDYTGAGSYTGTVLVTHHRHASFSGHRYAKVPVTLTTDGGSFTYSRTLSGKKHPALKGKTVSVSASWTCSV